MVHYIFKIFINDRIHFTDSITDNIQMFNTFLFGIRFIIKTISINETEIVNQIWVNNYAHNIDYILPALMRGSKAIIIIFDCKNPMNLVDDLTHLPNILTESQSDTIPVFLLGINSLQLNELEYMHLERTIQSLLLHIPNAHYINQRNVVREEPFFENILTIINKSFIYQEDIRTLINRGVETSKLFEIHRTNITKYIKNFEEQLKNVESIKDKIQNLNLVPEKLEPIEEPIETHEIEKIRLSILEFEKQKLKELRQKATLIMKKIKLSKEA